MFTASAVMTILYLGGYDMPLLPQLLGLQEGTLARVLFELAVFSARSVFFCFCSFGFGGRCHGFAMTS